MTDDVIYEGRGGKVGVHDPSGRRVRLPLARDVKDFSRSRLAWGLPARAQDPGQLQLAVALLAHALGKDAAAEHYQAFHDRVLPTLPVNWTLSEGEIRDHVGIELAPPEPAASSDPDVTLVDPHSEVPDGGAVPTGESPPASPSLFPTSGDEPAGDSGPGQ